MNEFNPNCGKCGMLNSRGFCSLTACRYPSNVIVVEPKVIRGMMVNPQIEKTTTNAGLIRAKSDEELAMWMRSRGCPTEEINRSCMNNKTKEKSCTRCWLDWLKAPADKEGEG